MKGCYNPLLFKENLRHCCHTQPRALDAVYCDLTNSSNNGGDYLVGALVVKQTLLEWPTAHCKEDNPTVSFIVDLKHMKKHHMVSQNENSFRLRNEVRRGAKCVCVPRQRIALFPHLQR